MKIKTNKNRIAQISLRSFEASHSVRLRKLVKGNPRREGSHGHKSFAVLKTGMTYDEYLLAGGRNRDLAWDVQKGYVALEAPKAEKDKSEASKRSSSKPTRPAKKGGAK